MSKSWFTAGTMPDVEDVDDGRDVGDFVEDMVGARSDVSDTGTLRAAIDGSNPWEGA
jgi:hypothetical protein